MLRFGLLPVLAVVTLAGILPYGLYRLSRALGAPLTVAGAVALGLAYGAFKADNPWSGDGLAVNLRIMAVSAAVLGAYAGVSVAVARAIARRL
ncbi:hypothetical protein DFR50_12144 [Roseiarcus fermentans]|uniref:Uncharacterized protein n=1 Tax=Roseiarcus fermentans TaxID=1473586 RepID=A0A366F7G5_9HYPH|nr:hypothetical protein DFR50_12144 [Roseiarcus fermentans]